MNLVVEGRRCLVVGAGPVAARKVAGLLTCGAQVTVVAPSICRELTELATPGAITYERRAYRRGEVARYALVITATNDPAVNQAVFDDGVDAGVWVNSADDPDRCSFTLPAVHRQGSILVTASTGGRSPALASWLRAWLEDQVGPEFAQVADRLAEERAALHAQGCSTEGMDWAPRIVELLARTRSGAPQP